ncbi:N-acetyl sugar amidotransferase [bacterium]|nr:N-acetyl sugar amidotransferase [bacterium]
MIDANQSPTERPYQICTVTVMDTTDPDIRFDGEGVCNYVGEYRAFEATLPGAEERQRLLEERIARIKQQGKGREYDCVLGLSGGVDSSYMAYLAKQFELRPLVVHFDNGWNSELAVKNIEELVTRLGFDLQTLVMEWEEFRDLQRSYFLASVIDIEVPTDQMILGTVNRLAAKHRIRTVLTGTNHATEWLLPRSWIYRKADAVNMRAIHERFGTVPLKRSPTFGVRDRLLYTYLRGIRSFEILDHVEYGKAKAKSLLMEKLGWRDYGGKHYESVFTRFYQGHVLPKKFGVDKRRAHLSNLILSGEITREEALAELEQPTYDPDLQQQDLQYVSKKLGFTVEEMEEILAQDPIPHEAYGTDEAQQASLMRWVTRVSKLRNFALRR